MPRSAERGGPQTRARIAEVAAGLFLERGYDAVTVAEVARAAGVSSVTVFKHFGRKEDLFLDRAEDAEKLLRATVRDRPAGADVLTSLRATVVGLAESRHALSGLNDRSVPFFRTVAASPALVARAREISAELQQVLAAELDDDPAFGGDGTLLAAFFVAGYAAVLVESARQMMAAAGDHADADDLVGVEVVGEPADVVAADHEERLDRLFVALRDGFDTEGR
ncbi:MAG TPA: TetR/AcrR family transcriptional regulator [Cellulomonas sp.]